MSSDPAPLGDLAWRVSSTCESAACVMVARRGDRVLVASTKHPAGPVSEFTQDEWREFLAGAKLGEFDELA
jgi:predicted secreted Zn-dependent protease